MSEEQLKAFLEKAQGDTSLQEKLKAAASPEAVIEIAKEAGFAITSEDIQSMQSEELSDDELEEAAVGGGHNCGFTAPRRDGRPATRMVRGPSCGRSH
ncbi:nif11-like leader peptide domain protein [Synechococcus sp. A18-25c]|uniref:Nif11-like leader peptide family natural product precursor n=1 Tax=Synechococcus sp. A18-25c TaxID=1866938 RepID=UPI0016496FC3|nr:Nif11-like leader peptide family natural product precursor [Synechococcus sp. A18-25c]QNJ19242.1 nif11-like leader peptide domain protein [Synechococcus sp. A18-25c]